MINLLPQQTKKDYHYGRANIVLRKWAFGLFVSIIIEALLVAGGMLYIQKNTSDLAAQNSSGAELLKSQKLDETQKQLTEIRDNLKLVDQVLSKQVDFPKLLSQVGASMPEGAVLTDLSIGKITGGIDIKVATIDNPTATQVQLNLQDPENKIFEKVDLININSTESAYGDKYFTTVQLRASFNKCNQFLVVATQCSTTGGSAKQ